MTERKLKAAKMMRRAQCPMCGERKDIFVAKQKDGHLLEDAVV